MRHPRSLARRAAARGQRPGRLGADVFERAASRLTDLRRGEQSRQGPRRKPPPPRPESARLKTAIAALHRLCCQHSRKPRFGARLACSGGASPAQPLLPSAPPRLRCARHAVEGIRRAPPMKSGMPGRPRAPGRLRKAGALAAAGTTRHVLAGHARRARARGLRAMAQTSLPSSCCEARILDDSLAPLSRHVAARP